MFANITCKCPRSGSQQGQIDVSAAQCLWQHAAGGRDARSVGDGPLAGRAGLVLWCPGRQGRDGVVCRDNGAGCRCRRPAPGRHDAGGMLAAVVFLSHPWVIHVSVNGLNDGVLACYVFLAIYAMWLARRGACSFLLPGLLAGAAAACKYPGLVFAVVPLAVWAVIPVGRISNPSRDVGRLRRGRFAKPSYAGAIALFLAGVLAGGSAWYVKNAALAGNPVYPLAYGVFGGRTRHCSEARPMEHGPPGAAQRTAAGAIHPVNSPARSPAIAGRDDLASPLILPLLAAAGIALLLAQSFARFRNPQSAIRNFSSPPSSHCSGSSPSGGSFRIGSIAFCCRPGRLRLCWRQVQH